MESILKAFEIGLILRSFFAGAFFVISFVFARSGFSFDKTAFSQYWLWAALLSGVSIYGLHRSVLYPIFEYFFTWKPLKLAREGGLTLISAATRKFLTDRWDKESGNCSAIGSESSNSDKFKYRIQQLKKWADIIHLQYVSAWCLVLGAVLGALSRGSITQIDWHFCGFPALVLASVATVSNWRSFSLEESWEIKSSDANGCCLCLSVAVLIVIGLGWLWLAVHLFEIMLHSISSLTNLPCTCC